jgi:hypothetical protein
MEQGISNHAMPLILCLLNKSTTETYEKLKRAYGDQSSSQVQVFQWHKDFLEGQDIIEDDLCTGRLVTAMTCENVDSVQDLMKSD